MDWLEEIVQKLNKKMEQSSLQGRLLYTVLVSTLFAMGAYILTRNISYSWILVIVNRYTTMDEFRTLMFFDQISGVPFSIQVGLLLLKLVYQYSIVPYTIVAIYLGVRFFIKNQIEVGLEAANMAVGYLTIGDFGHEQAHFAKDEIGQLCESTENLRQQLVETKRQEWEQQSEQSIINAAFAHDLRTPLTVMKGYTEFLLKYEPQGKVSKEALLEKLNIMYQHQNRLLEFSHTMTKIQTMEMRQLHCRWIPLTDIYTRARQTIEELEKQSKIKVEVFYSDEKEADQNLVRLSVDEDLVMEVCENLLSNALRYAKKKINIQMRMQEESLIFFFQDDGKGFSAKALKEAKTLYYSEEKGSGNHFGMGLYICEKLCKKHGGRLRLINGIQGGAITAAEFRILRKG